jgi:xylulokinase
VDKFIHAKDFVVLKLTGAIFSDFSDASGMNLLDIRELEWSEELMEAAGIERDKLPELVESVSVVGKVKRDAAAMSGLAEGTPVVIGGGDGACATCGAGVVKEGEAYVYLGTSTWMGLATEEPIIDPEKRTFTFCHFRKGLYMPAGTMQTGGGSLGWFKNELCGMEQEAAEWAGVDVYDLITLKAKTVPCGSGGLLFLPYLMGERSPWWNPGARGCFIGLTVLHTKSHLARAVLEGVAFNMRIIGDAFKEQGVRFDEIQMIGGGARSALWRSIFADVMEVPSLRLNFIEEATSVGAAIAGGVGVGLFSSIHDIQRFVKVEEKTPPDGRNIPIYRKQFALFRESYRQLCGVFEKLSSGDEA